MTKFIFGQVIPKTYPTDVSEVTSVEYELSEEGITADDALKYFIRFALAAGYQPESMQNAVIELAHEYEDSILRDKYRNV